jgi:hypothetical protein
MHELQLQIDKVKASCRPVVSVSETYAECLSVNVL